MDTASSQPTIIITESSEDPRPGLIQRCVDCGEQQLRRVEEGWDCTSCGRQYRFSEGGVLLAMPEADLQRLPAFYRTAFHRRWMAAWEDMIKEWVIYANKFYRFFLMSGHRKVADFLAHAGPEDGVVVDLGCGAGQLFEVVDCPFPVGVDTNLAFLELMKERYPHVWAIQADISNTPFADDSVSCPVSLHTIEHLYFLAESLEEVNRILTPNGHFIFSIPTEGGFGWKLGRKFVTGPTLRRKYDLDVERVMAIEHINDATRCLRFINFYFTIKKKAYTPFPFLPFLSINSAITGLAVGLPEDSEHRPEIAR